VTRPWPERSPVGRQLLALAGMVVVFYSAPVNTQVSTARTALAVLLTLLGIAALAWAITAQLKRQLHSRSEDVRSLVMLLVLVAMVFALSFYALEEHSPAQLQGLATRTDALYFTVSTLATVGFGDVHAVGQLARGLVILQLIFNVTFVGALVSTVAQTVRSRAPHAGGGRIHESQ
jgi:voltage-gated potassium channel